MTLHAKVIGVPPQGAPHVLLSDFVWRVEPTSLPAVSLTTAEALDLAHELLAAILKAEQNDTAYSLLRELVTRLAPTLSLSAPEGQFRTTVTNFGSG